MSDIPKGGIIGGNTWMPKEIIFPLKRDTINPDHYKVGGIETIDYMKAKLTKEQYAGYLLGNVIKYTSRFQHKNGVEDLKKAQWYLNKLVSENEQQSI